VHSRHLETPDYDPVMSNDAAVFDSSGTISESQLDELGWTLKPEGLCQDDTCVIVPDRAALVTDAGLDVEVLGGLLDRPVVIDHDAALAAIGAPRAARRQALDDLVAPDFALPNLDGGVTALSDHRSKKRLLIAFSSW
jgi:hypothetical protein